MRKGSRDSNGNVEEVASSALNSSRSSATAYWSVLETVARLSDQDAFTTAGGEFTTKTDNVSAFDVLARVAQIEIFLKCPPLDA